MFLLLRHSLVFLSVFCLFFRVVKGSHGENNPWCFRGFLWYFQKNQGKKRTGLKGCEEGNRVLIFCGQGLRKLLPATGVIWALRAQSYKKSRKMSSRGRGPKKSKTESEKGSKSTVFSNYFDSFLTPFSTFWAPRPRGPGNSLSDSFPTLGPEGPNDLCSRARVIVLVKAIIWSRSRAGENRTGETRPLE